MEVHAHTHTERKRFKHYLFEFFMLFLAITLGFLVENFREHTVENRRLTRFAQQLVRGLQRDTSLQNEMINVLSDKEAAFDSLRYFLAMPKDDSIKWEGIYDNAWGLENPFRYSFQKPVFDQITNSGSLRLFTNDSIADSLLEYIYNGTLIQWQSDAEISYITQVVIPFMNLHFDKNLIAQRFGTHIKIHGLYSSTEPRNMLPQDFLRESPKWKSEFANIVITAREKHELPFQNIIEERNRALILISSLEKEYRLK